MPHGSCEVEGRVEITWNNQLVERGVVENNLSSNPYCQYPITLFDVHYECMSANDRITSMHRVICS